MAEGERDEGKPGVDAEGASRALRYDYEQRAKAELSWGSMLAVLLGSACSTVQCDACAAVPGTTEGSRQTTSGSGPLLPGESEAPADERDDSPDPSAERAGRATPAEDAQPAALPPPAVGPPVAVALPECRTVLAKPREGRIEGRRTPGGAPVDPPLDLQPGTPVQVIARSGRWTKAAASARALPGEWWIPTASIVEFCPAIFPGVRVDDRVYAILESQYEEGDFSADLVELPVSEDRLDWFRVTEVRSLERPVAFTVLASRVCRAEASRLAVLEVVCPDSRVTLRTLEIPCDGREFHSHVVRGTFEAADEHRVRATEEPLSAAQRAAAAPPSGGSTFWGSSQAPEVGLRLGRSGFVYAGQRLLFGDRPVLRIATLSVADPELARAIELGDQTILSISTGYEGHGAFLVSSTPPHRSLRIRFPLPMCM